MTFKCVVSNDLCQQLLNGLTGLLLWTFMFLFQIKISLTFHVVPSLSQNMSNNKDLIRKIIRLQSLYLKKCTEENYLLLKNMIVNL